MIVRVKLFAAARELAGTGEVPVEVAAGARVSDVERAVQKQFPALESVLKHARWAVNAAFVSLDSSVTEKSEIALIPPVSGG